MEVEDGMTDLLDEAVELRDERFSRSRVEERDMVVRTASGALRASAP